MNRKVMLFAGIVFFSSCNINKKISLECNIEVSKTKVNFASCYNGLTISELQVNDSIIGLYPHNYEKKVVYELSRKDTSQILKTNNLEVNFYNEDDRFLWRYYKSVEGHNNDDVYFDMPYETKGSLGNIFKPNTWYLFNFFNPHFQLFVYSDSSLNLRAVKEKLNPNF